MTFYNLPDTEVTVEYDKDKKLLTINGLKDGYAVAEYHGPYGNYGVYVLFTAPEVEDCSIPSHPNGPCLHCIGETYRAANEGSTPLTDESIWPQCPDCGLPMLDPSDHDCVGVEPPQDDPCGTTQ